MEEITAKEELYSQGNESLEDLIPKGPGLVVRIDDLNNGPDTNGENRPEPALFVGWKWTF